MQSLTDVDAATLCAGHLDWAGPDVAERLARHPLEGLETEFPHATGAMASPDDCQRPSERHPVFYGCFDWHSAVHSHWALVRQLRLFGDHPDEAAVVESVDARLTPEHVEREVAHFEANPGFEKPYGWAWFLHLAAELDRWDDERADAWRATLAPLEDAVRSLVEEWLQSVERPFRVGTHGNTAFALSCVLDYAHSTGREDLAATAAETARAFYGADRDYPVAYEPLGWDFLSPALTEADLLRRVYDREAFAAWAEDFFPDVESDPHASILDPVDASTDAEEGVALHLVGLDVSRAWCLAGLADALPEDHRCASPFAASARRHAERGAAAAFTDDYAGAHWLSSFALYLLSRNEGGVAPGTG